MLTTKLLETKTFLIAALALSLAACSTSSDAQSGDIPDGFAVTWDGAVGPDGDGPVAPLSCPGEFDWVQFIATAAESSGLPSVYYETDLRAGSLAAQFNGGMGFDRAEGDPAFATAFVTLRNGAGTIVEEWQLNRADLPARLTEDTCSADHAYPQCWRAAPEDSVDGALIARLPTLSGGSNVGFDESGERVTVAGMADLTALPGEATDNTHERLQVRFRAPRGVAATQLLLRGAYQPVGIPLGVSDHGPMPLMRAGWPGPFGDVDMAPVVELLHRTETDLVIELNVEEALQYMCGVYRGCEVTAQDFIRVQGDTVSWRLANDGAEAVPIDILDLRWPASNGALVDVLLDDVAVLAERVEAGPTRIRLVDDVSDERRTVAPGGSLTLGLVFAAPASEAQQDYAIRASSLTGCVVEASPSSCVSAVSACDEGGLPMMLSFQYAGTSCNDSAFAQDADQVECRGDPKFASPVRITVTDTSEPPIVYHQAEHALGDSFPLDPAAVGAVTTPSRTRVRIERPSGELLQEIEFATACEQPLAEGDLFGSARLLSCGASL